MSTIRSSEEVIAPFLEDGELDLGQMQEAINEILKELHKPAANQPNAIQFAQLTQSFAANAVGMLANQVASLHAEIGHLSNVLHMKLDPDFKPTTDPEAMATDLRDLMVQSIELDRLRRILDLVHDLNRPRLEVPR